MFLRQGGAGLPPASIDRDGASCRGTSVLRQRADAARRAFNRAINHADALVTLAQGISVAAIGRIVRPSRSRSRWPAVAYALA
jgi:hypothetical protein